MLAKNMTEEEVKVAEESALQLFLAGLRAGSINCSEYKILENRAFLSSLKMGFRAGYQIGAQEGIRAVREDNAS